MSKKTSSNLATFDYSKVWVLLFILFNLMLLLLYWGVKNQEVASFLYQNPVVIIPYLIEKLGIFKFLLGIAGIIFLVPFILSLPSNNSQKAKVLRGAEIISTEEMKKIFSEKAQKSGDKIKIHIAGIPIPENLENYGFFFFGSPGTGKSQSISQILSVLKERNDFRGIIFDRNGEMLRKFYDPQFDLIYNPFDERSVAWCHQDEPLKPETIAECLIPLPEDDKQDAASYFQNAGNAVMTEIFRKAKNNKQVYDVLLWDNERLQKFLANTNAATYVAELKLASSVITTLKNYCRFYRYLKSPKQDKLSFYNWALSDDPRWIFITLRATDTSILKPLHSALFELMLKGLISNENRKLKTAIVIDELGSLNRLPSLGVLLSEGRKFNACPFLGTQTEAQITKIYGKDNTSIILQGIRTKLMLRSNDPHTAETMAKTIGKSEKLRYKTNIAKTAANFKSPASKTRTVVEEITESFAVLPTEMQNLDDLEGYLKIEKFVSLVQVPITSFPSKNQNFVDCIDLDK